MSPISTPPSSISKSTSPYVPPISDPIYQLQKVLREDGLGDLIQKNVKIVNEVKGLDTDMQKLVYENYSKFMSATKTIKTLQVELPFLTSLP